MGKYDEARRIFEKYDIDTSQLITVFMEAFQNMVVEGKVDKALNFIESFNILPEDLKDGLMDFYSVRTNSMMQSNSWSSLISMRKILNHQ